MVGYPGLVESGGRYQHFLLTRMNTETPFGTRRAHVDPDWLAHRFTLFETYTLPSVMAQVELDFMWLLFSHEKTPPEFRDRLRSYERSFPALRIVTCTVFDEDVARREVLARCDEDVTHIITSRVDNDDALGARYTSLVKREFTAQEGQFINFDDGLQLHGKCLYTTTDTSNPYCSSIERLETYRGVFCVAHVDISTVYPVKHITDERIWLTVIHDRNAMNSVDGSRCTSAQLRDEFDFLRARPLNDHTASIIVDRQIRRLRIVRRRTRSWLRSIVRRRS